MVKDVRIAKVAQICCDIFVQDIFTYQFSRFCTIGGVMEMHLLGQLLAS